MENEKLTTRQRAEAFDDTFKVIDRFTVGLGVSAVAMLLVACVMLLLAAVRAGGAGL